jgi:hypothetical protein
MFHSSIYKPISQLLKNGKTNYAARTSFCEEFTVSYREVQGDQKVSGHQTITVKKTPTIDDLKMAITEYIRNVDRAIPNAAFENTVRRVNKCLETGGGHFEHYL